MRIHKLSSIDAMDGRRHVQYRSVKSDAVVSSRGICTRFQSQILACWCRSMKRYQHYCSRWEAHVNSSKHMGKHRTAIQTKMAVLEESNSTLKDYTWLMQVGFTPYIIGLPFLFAGIQCP